MYFWYNLYFIILSLTAIISASVAYAAWQKRSICSASTPFIAMMWAVTGYAMVAAMEAVVVTLPEKIFWSKLEYVGSGSVITFFLIFAMHFTNNLHWLSPRNTAKLWIIPIFNMALVATNEWHGLVWSDFLLDPKGTNAVIYEHNVGFFWVMGCVYSYTLIGIFMLLQKAFLPSVLYRRQSGITIVGVACPLLAATLYMLRLTPVGLNITPMSFMLTGVFLFISVFRFRMFDLVPVARDTLIERMSDGVVVLDAKNRIIDMNPAAKRLIRAKQHHIGQPIEQFLAKWQEIIRLHYSHESAISEIVIDLATPIYVELQITPLHNQRKQLTGRLLVLHDISQRYQVELELRQANQRLQKQVLEIQTLQAQLREQATRDGLTGLFNRRYFDEVFPKKLLQAIQDAAPVALMIMDIDHFKNINDTFGHQVGDIVIQAFADLLHKYSDSQEMACRYGGEEFVLALPGVGLEKALERAEKIRSSFQMIRWKFAGKEISTTVSGGVGVFPKHGNTKDELLHAVDLALYAAKLDGRNCIKCVTSN